MARGDVLFWTSDGSPVSRLICAVTHGPFCHVSVDLGDGYDIGAHSEDGVQRRHVPDDRGITKLHLTPPFGVVPPERIEVGITFLEGEIGNKYGWCNILNAGLAFLHLPYRLSRLDRYDCSSLVARYLTIIGYAMGDLGEEPDSVSPNDIARWMGVIKK